MGASLCCGSNLFPGKDTVRLLLLGLEGAGKTTILKKLSEDIETTTPAIGFNIETGGYKHILITSWDLKGEDETRPIWKHYYDGVHAIIFVVDSTDEKGIDNASDGSCCAAEELNKMLAEEELEDALLLVLANKQDLETAMSVDQIKDRLGLNKLQNRKWHIQKTNATTETEDKGIRAGLKWISDTMQEKESVEVDDDHSANIR